MTKSVLLSIPSAIDFQLQLMDVKNDVTHITTCTEYFCSKCVPQYGAVQSLFYNCEENHFKNVCSFSVSCS